MEILILRLDLADPVFHLESLVPQALTQSIHAVKTNKSKISFVYVSGNVYSETSYLMITLLLITSFHEKHFGKYNYFSDYTKKTLNEIVY
jgi:hypothetical protein